MSMGYTQTPATQMISPETQAEMLVALLDSLHIDSVDLIGSDSGGLLAQIFLTKYPKRVRTLLLTNCDVDENSPPPQFAPLVTLAEKGAVADTILLPMLNNKNVARSAKTGPPYTYPERLSDEMIEMYYRPLVKTQLRKAQLDQFTIALGKPGKNVLIPIREDLRQWKGPARMVWGLKDALFGVEWAEWLDKTLPGSRGIRRLEQANLLFPEEMPDVIAEEAKGLWGVG
jgi:pimeloyl-ACP methyl ester carboxylesterase